MEKHQYLINKDFKKLKMIYDKLEEKDLSIILKEFDILQKIDNLPFDGSYLKDFFIDFIKSIIKKDKSIELNNEKIIDFFNNITSFINSNEKELKTEKTFMSQEYFFRGVPNKESDYFSSHAKKEVNELKRKIESGKQIEVREIFSLVQVMHQLEEIKRTGQIEYIHSFRTAYRNNEDEMFRPIINSNATMFYGWLLENFNKEYIKEKKSLSNINNIKFEDHKNNSRYEQFKYAMKVKILKEEKNKFYTQSVKRRNETVQIDDLNRYSQEEITEDVKDKYESLLTEENYQKWLENNRTFNVMSFDLEGVDKYGNKIVIDVKNQSGVSMEHNIEKGQRAGFIVKHSPQQWINRFNNVDKYNKMTNQKSYYALFHYVMEEEEMTTSMIPTVVLKKFFYELQKKMKNEKNKIYQIPEKYSSTYDITKDMGKIEIKIKELKEKNDNLLEDIKEVDNLFLNCLKNREIKNDLFDEIKEEKETFSEMVFNALNNKDMILLKELLSDDIIKEYIVKLNVIQESQRPIPQQVKELYQDFDNCEEYLLRANKIINNLDIKDMEFNGEKFDISFKMDDKENNKHGRFKANFDGLEKSNVLTTRIIPHNKAGFLKAQGEQFILDSTIENLKEKALKKKEKVKKNREKRKVQQ